MRHWLHGAIATCSFELRRSFTVQRTAVSAGLALFPGVMMFLLIRGPQLVQREVPGQIILLQAFSLFSVVFLVSLVCLLSLLLWAPTNVSSELEGKSWGFLASRPGGRIACYLGKYGTAFFVSYMVSVIALSIALGIANHYLPIEEPIQKWIALCGIYALACAVYGAVFSMIGTIFTKRAMVVAAGYLIVSDLFLATLPAVVNKFTVRYHLQTLGISWLGWFLPDSQTEYNAIFGSPWPDWVCLLALGSMALITLIVGSIVVVSRQYVSSDEG